MHLTATNSNSETSFSYPSELAVQRSPNKYEICWPHKAWEALLWVHHQYAVLQQFLTLSYPCSFHFLLKQNQSHVRKSTDFPSVDIRSIFLQKKKKTVQKNQFQYFCSVLNGQLVKMTKSIVKLSKRCLTCILLWSEQTEKFHFYSSSPEPSSLDTSLFGILNSSLTFHLTEDTIKIELPYSPVENTLANVLTLLHTKTSFLRKDPRRLMVETNKPQISIIHIQKKKKAT